MASNPLFIIPDFFFCIFQINFATGTLGLNENEKFLWESREIVLPSCSLVLRNRDSQQAGHPSSVDRFSKNFV